MSIKIGSHEIPEEDYGRVLVEEETEYQRRTDLSDHTDFKPLKSAVITVIGLDQKHHDFMLGLYKSREPFSIRVTEKNLEGDDCRMPRPPSSFLKIRSTTIRYIEEEED